MKEIRQLHKEERKAADSNENCRCRSVPSKVRGETHMPLEPVTSSPGPIAPSLDIACHCDSSHIQVPRM
jgi:hypothetical protein